MRGQPYSSLLGSYREFCSTLWKQFRSWPALHVDKILFSWPISNQVKKSSWSLSVKNLSLCWSHNVQPIIMLALWSWEFWKCSSMCDCQSKLWRLGLGSSSANIWGEMQREAAFQWFSAQLSLMAFPWISDPWEASLSPISGLPVLYNEACQVSWEVGTLRLNSSYQKQTCFLMRLYVTGRAWAHSHTVLGYPWRSDPVSEMHGPAFSF